MGKGAFYPGHPSYYDAKKKIEVNRFRDVWDLYGKGEISQKAATEMLGVTRPTFVKWRNAIIMNGDIDRSLDFLIWDNSEGNNEDD